MPLLAPVTTAVLPVNLPMLSPLTYRGMFSVFIILYGVIAIKKII